MTKGRTPERHHAKLQDLNPRKIILFDVMDTLVTDPFYHHVPRFFNLSFKDLLQVKHPDMWIRFEKGEIDEKCLMQNFFRDGRSFDHASFIEMMCQNYRYMDGMQEVLEKLSMADAEIHAFSNYPVWHTKIEDKLKLSKYLTWTFVSCQGPMKGVRKPDDRAYDVVLKTLGCRPSEVLLIDDREQNIKAGKRHGIDGILFKDVETLIVDLQARGWNL